MTASRVAIVTGSGTGLGAAVAKALAARGWRVVVNYRRSAAAARDTAAACESLGGEVSLCRGDVSADGDCRRLAKRAIKRWGRIDALVNNAGATTFVAAADLEGLSKADFQRIYATNVIGAFQMTRAVAPAMRGNDGGSIVNVSSFAGEAGFGSSLAYAASKGALNTLTVGLARALAPAIRVNAICPSFIDTRWLSDSLDPESHRAFKSKIAGIAPLGDMPAAAEVARAVVWLIEDAALVTGELLKVDGGMHLAHPLAPTGAPTGGRERHGEG